MADIVLPEKTLRFTFKSVDFSEKYDDWAHYKQIFQNAGGSPVKAVDFVVVKGRKLWLIEVKDYREYPRKKTLDLSKEVALKVKGTLGGLVSAAFMATEPNEQKCARQALDCSSIQVVLHLEQENTGKKIYAKRSYEANLLGPFKRQMKFIDDHPKIISKESISDLSGLQLSVQ